MDILGTVVNIAHITRHVVEFVREAREAPADREKLVIATFAASGVIETFRILYESSGDAPWKAKIVELSTPQGVLKQYEQLLQKILKKALQNRAVKGNLLNKLDRGWNTVTWPFDKKSVDSLLFEIEGIKSSLMLAVSSKETSVDHSLRHIQLSDVQIELGRSIHSNLDRIENKIDGIISDQKHMLGNQKEMLDDHFNAKLMDMCNWLYPSDVQQQLRGSLRTFKDSRPSWYLDNKAFKEWEAGIASSRTLWCPGNPGAGKTVLSSFLIDELREKYTGSGSAAAIFFCNYKVQQSEEQTANAIIRCLSRQLLEQESQLFSFVEQYRESSAITRSESQAQIADDQELMRILVSDLKNSFIIIDALDECADREKTKLMRHLNTLLSETPSMRLLVTSRENQQHIFSQVPRMDIMARDEDIKSFLQSRIENIDPLSALSELSKDELTGICNKVIERSFGVFLIAKSHMDALEECERKDKLRMRAENLSENTDGIYDDALKRIMEQKEDRRVLAETALLWIVHARRILDCEEILHAVATSTSCAEDDFDDNAVASEKLLVASCGGLIIVNANTKGVTIHQSLQEYFERGGKKSLYFPNANAKMARICLKYLSFDRFGVGHCKNEDSWDARARRNRLLEYAAQNWGWHVRDAHESGFLDDILALLRHAGRLASAAQALSRYPICPDSFGSQSWLAPHSNMSWFPHGSSPVLPALHLATYFGLVSVMNALLDENCDVNERSEDGRTAFCIAAYVGPLSSASLLLDRGADPKMESVRGITALHSAASANNPDIVQRILSCDKEVSSDLIARTNFIGKTPLHDASERGHTAVVKILLNAGADPCAPDGNRTMPMHYAARYGHLDILTELFSSPQGGQRTLEVRKKFEHMPIHEAAVHGRGAAVKLLVQLGTSIESKQWTDGTALYQACEFGKPNTAKILLDLGANIMASDKWGRTCLTIAAENGQLSVVEILLQYRSDPAFLEARGQQGNTALLKAAEKMRLNTFGVLLNAGADLRVANNLQETALHIAARNDDLEMVNVILKRPEGKDLLERTTKTTLNTPLHEAMALGHVQIVRRLVDAEGPREILHPR